MPNNLLSKICYFCFLLAGPWFFFPAWAQSTSNKGTDFWIGYPSHINGTNSQMDLYITSTENATVTVSVPGTGFSTTASLTANSIITVDIPSSAYVATSETIENKGIHVTATQPVVVFSHIFINVRSAATLVLPTATLGREYYAITYPPDQSSQYAELMVVATEDNTTVEITPTAATRSGRPANTTFQVTLNKGQVYQVQSSQDLTGSRVVSVSNSGGTCKKIAVYSGNTYVGIGCTNINRVTRDNLFQEMYPVSTWGQNYAVASLKTRTAGDIFRILASTDNTVVKVGTATYTINKGQFATTEVNGSAFIEADKPVTVAQYTKTQGCDNVTGDPEMIILNPIEQTLQDITVYSTPRSNITGQYINIIIKTADAASFQLDGQSVTFTAITGKADYSVAKETVTAGSHRLTASGGFNAIAYGFGNAESYGYSAGADIKNLNQYIVADKTTLCGAATVNLSAKLTYTPQSYLWDFGDNTTSTEAAPSHTYTAPGTYLVSLVTTKANSLDCESQDSSTYQIQVDPTINLELGADLTVCSGETVTLGAAAVTGFTYTWSPSTNLSSASSANPQFRLLNNTNSAITQKYYLTAVNATTGCTARDSITITVNPEPGRAAGPDVAVCQNKTVKIGLAAESGYTYQWSPATYLSDPTQAQPDFLYTGTLTSATTFQYIRTITRNTCTAADTVVVTVNPLPGGEIRGSASVCPNVTGVGYQIVNPGNNIFAWGVTGGSIASNSGSAITVNWGNANAAALVYAIPTNSNGCVGDTIKFPVRINVLLIPEKPQGPDSLCRKDLTNVTYSVQPTNGSVYTWHITGGEIISGQGTAQIQVTWNETNNGKLWLNETSVTATDRCFGTSDTLYFNLIKNTTALEITSVGTQFENEKNMLIQYVISTQSQYPADKTFTLQRRRADQTTWETVAAVPLQSSQYVDAGLETDLYSYAYLLTGTNTCDSVLTSAAHQSILLGGTSEISQTIQASQVKLQWSAYQGWSVSAIPYEVWNTIDAQPDFSLKQTLNTTSGSLELTLPVEGFALCYRIRATSGNLESWSNSICFELENDLFIPNIITPNGDGMNDQFHVRNLQYYPGTSLKVFNRWGQQIYSNDNYQNDWEGKNLSHGTYYYQLTTKVKPKTYKGWVEIMQ